VHAKGWNQKLAALNMARNGIVHDDGTKIARVQAEGASCASDSELSRTILSSSDLSVFRDELAQ
jgi:hypothetical protein